jgi:hypothetical protein
LKKEMAAAVTGGIVAAGILAAEHYLMKREHLSRTRAYMAGVAGLDIGQLVYWRLNGRKASPLGAALVQLLGGGTVIAAYWGDRSQRVGQLQETLNRVTELESTLIRQAGQLAAMEQELAGKPVRASDIGLLSLQLNTVQEDLTKVSATLEAAQRAITNIRAKVLATNSKKYGATKHDHS